MSCMGRPPKKKKNGPCREVTVKEETPYTDWNQWGNTTEYWRLLQGRNMVYGLRAQSQKYDWDQGSEEKGQGSEEWYQGSQGF